MIPDKQFEILFEEIHTEHSIQCSNCGEISKEYNCSEEDAIKSFYTEGWRAVKNQYCCCPQCAEINGA